MHKQETGDWDARRNAWDAEIATRRAEGDAAAARRRAEANAADEAARAARERASDAQRRSGNDRAPGAAERATKGNTQ